MASPKLRKAQSTGKSAEEISAEVEEREIKTEVTEAIDGGLHLVEEEYEKVYDLMCGYTDENGITHKTFTTREVLGVDEEAVRRPEYKQNPSKAMNFLISRCVTSIGTLERKNFTTPEWIKIIQSMSSGDLDVMYLTIHKESIREELTTTHECPSCKAKLNTAVPIDELTVVPYKGKPVVNFLLPKGYRDSKGVVHREGTMRLTNGLDRELLTPLARANIAKATTLLLTRVCKFTDGAYIDEDVMAHLTIRDREYLNKLIQEETVFGYDFTTEVTCTECGETFRGALNAANFMR